MRRPAGTLLAVAVGLVAALPAAAASAQVATHRDMTAAVGVTPAPGVTVGTGSSFGGMLGDEDVLDGPRMGWDSNILGELRLTLTNAICTTRHGRDAVIVVYVDSIAGAGWRETPAVSPGTPDKYLRAVQAFGAQLVFPPGFRPDHAVAFDNPAAGTVGGHRVFPLAGAPTSPIIRTYTNAECARREVLIDLRDLGLAPGDSFGWMATVVDTGSMSLQRADEFQAAPGASSSNDVTTLQGDDHAVFESVGSIRVNEVESVQRAGPSEDFVELQGAPDVRLDGLALFATVDRTAGYASADLAGRRLNLSGLFLWGGPPILVDEPFSAPGGGLRDEVSAVVLYVPEVAAAVISNVQPSRIAHSVVYSDGSDGSRSTRDLLLATYAEPDLDEDAAGNRAGDSLQRCPTQSEPDPARNDDYGVGEPTPLAPNRCGRCGDGVVDFRAEDCDDPTNPCCLPNCRFKPEGETCTAMRPPETPCDRIDLCDGRGGCFEPAEGEPCDDGLFCNGASDRCANGQCVGDPGALSVCGPEPADPCARVVCSESQRACVPAAPEGCCTEDRPCDDGDVCTTDGACDLATNSCPAPVRVPGCCTVDAQCADDGDICTSARCVANRCEAAPIPECCHEDAECDGDPNDCVALVCSEAHRCVSSPDSPAGCCARDLECDDGNPCTEDLCASEDMSCSNTLIAGCCVSDASCDDSDRCTAGACEENRCVFEEAPDCCRGDGECDDGLDCSEDTCDPGSFRCRSDRSGCVPDAGLPDAGAPDAGAGERDGSVGSDAGFDAGSGETVEFEFGGGGCVCRAASGRPARGRGLAALALIGLAFVLRRRG